MSGQLRELHKRRRRRAILQAVRDLLREGGEGTPTKERIAERAEVAPATVYNLIGACDSLWGALAEDFMDELERRLDERRAADPVARVRQIVETTVELFVEDPVVSARMLRGWEASGQVLRRGPILHLVVALGEAQDAGVLSRDVEARVLASSVATGCVGAVHQWAAGLIDADKLRARALLAADVALAAAAMGRHRDRMLRALRNRRAAKGAREDAA
jgi:AcrR family transcriptional regulator